MPNRKLKAATLLKKNKFDYDGLAKDFAKNGFWHYTKAGCAQKILNVGGCGLQNKSGFLCSPITDMNDETEKKLHGENGQNVFLLCFCNTKSEKIPMWYLYGGITGNGVAIGITPKNMLNFIKSINKVYSVKSTENQNNENEFAIDKELVLNHDFDLEWGFVFYKKSKPQKGNKLPAVKFRNFYYDVNGFEKYEKDCYFIKDYCWEYESEFRIIIKNKLGEKIEKVFIPLPEETFKGLKLMFAPESKNEEQKWVPPLEKSKITNSKIGIKMNLLNSNTDEVIKYVNEQISKKGSSSESKKYTDWLNEKKQEPLAAN